jgi:hypothetical protein
MTYQEIILTRYFKTWANSTALGFSGIGNKDLKVSLFSLSQHKWDREHFSHNSCLHPSTNFLGRLPNFQCVNIFWPIFNSRNLVEKQANF